ncbi:putative S-adenosyl-L-methionine-dependent methyltransferase [Helianthus annuus]|nr:putative S-adenosyl-L-methionine-dependent methyltransferase [Helianthus annuus]
MNNKSNLLSKSSILILLALSFFYFGKHFSNTHTFQQLIFSISKTPKTLTLSISPNHNKTFNIPSLINTTSPPLHSPSLSPPPPPPSPPAVQRFGLLDENGVMRSDFEVGEFDQDAVESWNNETEVVDGEDEVRVRVRVWRFDKCPVSMSEYIPCMDDVEGVKRLGLMEKGESFERHCPEKDKGFKCLVPAPKGYKPPIPWPRSRDEVWYSNVPHAQLAEYKGGQNWIVVNKDKFRFPGGGTQFIHGADQYIDQISAMVPEIAFGQRTRVVLDIGCGVASFGTHLSSRNVLTLSIAPKDVHENQIQFALERGVPAMVAAFATRRLLYPSQAFDLIHCSRCRVNWTRDDGILLLEVNRLLRAGGYFVWAAQPVYKHKPLLEQQWEEMLNLTNRLCWNLVKKEGYVAIWQKPIDNTCYLSRGSETQPPLCDNEDNPDNVWYVDLKPCITPLPDDKSGANIATWPARLHNPPERLRSITFDAFVSRKDLFKAESKYWREIIDSYVRSLHWKKFKLRNVMDMRAGFGGFAAALIDNQLDCWVMNVVPVSGPNTLPVIYDRGLLGVMHDWCEPFDTYPRAYDLLHAAGVFSTEQKRCNISSIMLEMDRILRPGGRVYIRDSITVMDELQGIGKAIGWRVTLRDTAEGPHAGYKILKSFSDILDITYYLGD